MLLETTRRPPLTPPSLPPLPCRPMHQGSTFEAHQQDIRQRSSLWPNSTPLPHKSSITPPRLLPPPHPRALRILRAPRPSPATQRLFSTFGLGINTCFPIVRNEVTPHSSATFLPSQRPLPPCLTRYATLHLVTTCFKVLSFPAPPWPSNECPLLLQEVIDWMLLFYHHVGVMSGMSCRRTG